MSITKILVVEDDPMIAMDLEESFEDMGMHVIGPAAGVKEALALVDEMEPECATLDYNLGSDTSLPIANELAKRGIPFVFVTGYVDEIKQDLAHEFAPVVLKPAQPRKILDRIRSFADRLQNQSPQTA